MIKKLLKTSYNADCRITLTFIFIIISSIGLAQMMDAQTLPLTSMAGWKTMDTPKSTRMTDYQITDGRIHIQSDQSHSGITWQTPINIHKTPILSFSWKVSAIIASANIANKAIDDAPIRVLILFTEDTARKSFARRQIDKLFLWIYDKLPYDYSLAYVWANRAHEGPYVEGAYSHKLRSIVLDHGDVHVGQWRTHRINLYQDFKRIYGAEPPQRATMGILSDTDNTDTQVSAWIKSIQIH